MTAIKIYIRYVYLQKMRVIEYCLFLIIRQYYGIRFNSWLDLYFFQILKAHRQKLSHILGAIRYLNEAHISDSTTCF